MDYQAKQADMRNTYGTQAAQQEYGLANAAVVREPGPMGKAHEALNYVRELEQAQRELRLRLFGPSPEAPEQNLKNPNEPCLEDLLREICQRSAMAVGEIKSILGRL